MPALVNSRVGSPGGTRGAPDMRLWPRSSKKRRNELRISSGFTAGFVHSMRIRRNYSVGGWQARDERGHDASLKAGASSSTATCHSERRRYRAGGDYESPRRNLRSGQLSVSRDSSSLRSSE